MKNNAISYIDGHRHDVLRLLARSAGNVGVELGVATGVFSERMVSSGFFASFFGVDMYSDMHDVEEYKAALRRVGMFSNYKLLRMTFDQALDLFPDDSLDFVYVDGYAHTGEEGGDTIHKWARKLKIGGIISGDDYDPQWPLVMKSVQSFIDATGFDLHLTTMTEMDSPYCRFPTWAAVKTHGNIPAAPASSVLLGKSAGLYVSFKRFVIPRLKARIPRLFR